MPLLMQFIIADNDKLLHVHYFGVSAQGGDVGDKDIRKKLLSNDPCNRILVIDEEKNESKDITLPLLQALGIDNEE
ncbi:hypothetical protein AGMMS49942_28590 [Spirochaetia bacterium]|nr:hypothetical protein AGMMS49942_28590 [Spirochaetia bacterium]